jgi:hypothetical protein
VLDESLYKPRVPLLVLRILGLLDLETKELVLFLHCLCIVHAIAKLGRHLKVLRSQISHFSLKLITVMGGSLVLLTQVLQFLNKVSLNLL